MSVQTTKAVINDCELIAERTSVTYARDKYMDDDGVTVAYDDLFVRLPDGSGLIVWTTKYLDEVMMESWKKGERMNAKYDKNVSKLTFEKRLKELLEEAQK